MDILSWLWWIMVASASMALKLLWFLISGWVSTLLQIAVLVIAIYLLKYGWQRARWNCGDARASLAAFSGTGCVQGKAALLQRHPPIVFVW